VLTVVMNAHGWRVFIMLRRHARILGNQCHDMA
jgi:hypothetical protein